MKNIFQYFGLATAVLATVSALQNVFHNGPITGKALADAVDPTVDALNSTIPHVNIPASLVLEIGEAVAEVIKTYFAKQAVLTVSATVTGGNSALAK